MFVEHSSRELLIWIAGLLVATAITILGLMYVVDHYLITQSLDDLLTNQGDLSKEQTIRPK